MKKNQVNALLYNQTKRRNTVFALISVIIIVSIIALSFFMLYFERSKKQYVSYNETSNIDYKVYLDENEFFENNYLDKNNRYIASLINYINASFKYKLSLNEENVEYKYSYRIEADVKVVEKGTDNPLYNSSKTLLKKEEITSSLNEIIINENINIDYNNYNNLIKKLITFYNLNDTESTLTINMYVNVVGSCEKFEEDNSGESVMSLTIPLTTNTVGIDISNNLINSENNIIQCKSTHSNNFVFMLLGIITILIDLTLIAYTIKYEIATRTAENIYEKELKKILNNYSSYIQMIGNDFEFNDYQLLKVNTFTDMLEISDRIKQPILMKENNEKTGAYFVIPSNTKILYVYRLKVSDIQKEMKKNIKEDVEDLEDF